MNQIENVKSILVKDFLNAQTRNPNFSMRAYARKIGMPQSALSEIFSGKRPLTKKSAYKILQGLDKDPNEIAAILNDGTNNKEYEPIDINTFHVISDWYYYAILSLAETEDFQSSPKWIAKRLGLSEPVAAAALEKLVSLKMLTQDKNTNEVSVTGAQFEVASEVATIALRKANRQNLELANDALENVPVPERDFTAITLCFDPERIAEARDMIKKFRRNFNRVMESSKKKEVYKLCVQLFPLSKRGSK